MTASLHTSLCDLLGCDYPVILAGMGGVARSDLVAAVTKAGGFGFLGMVREPPELIGAEVARVRAATERDFGVNVIPAATPPALLDAQIELCLALKVPVIGLFWDLNDRLVDRLRREGVIVVCQVGTAEEAVAAERAGAHIIIAQGVEAGGHVRGATQRMRLLAETVSRVSVPVVAAGGIVDGGDLATVLKARGQGVAAGTAFLATHESFAHDYHKLRIVEADGNDTLLTDVFHINWPRGARVRVIANSVTRGEQGDTFGPIRRVIGEENARPIYLFSTDSPLRSMTGDFEAMALYAGEGCGRIVRVITAAARLAAIVAEAEAALNASAADLTENPPTSEFQSDVCFAGEAVDSYMGYLGREEVTEFLNDTLEGERAAARVMLRTSLDATTPALKETAARIHSDEKRCCAMLRKEILRLGGKPSGETGPFYRAAMAIAETGTRLAYFRHDRARMMRKLNEILPRVHEDRLHAELSAMLESVKRVFALVESA